VSTLAVLIAVSWRQPAGGVWPSSRADSAICAPLADSTLSTLVGVATAKTAHTAAAS
jgi:hypothetical protein